MKDHRKRKYNLRMVINAILQVLRTGCQWRNLKHPLVPWRSVYYYFRKWKRDGTLERLNATLNQQERKRQGKAATPSLLCIDSQSVKVASFISQDKGIDGNKCINGRKKHLIVDTLGLVWGVVVHAADIADGAKAHLLVEHCLGYLHRMQKILVDYAYKNIFFQWVTDNIAGLEVEFSAKPPSQQGFIPVKWRWVNERTYWLRAQYRLSVGSTSFVGMPKIMKKRHKAPKHGFYGPIAKLFLTGFESYHI